MTSPCHRRPHLSGVGRVPNSYTPLNRLCELFFVVKLEGCVCGLKCAADPAPEGRQRAGSQLWRGGEHHKSGARHAATMAEALPQPKWTNHPTGMDVSKSCEGEVGGVGDTATAASSRSNERSPRRRRKMSSACAETSDVKQYAPSINYSFEDLKNGTQWRFLADNDFIRNGYRASLSAGQALRSMFAWHNETVNVWSHGLGATVFIVLMIGWIGFPMARTPAEAAMCGSGVGGDGGVAAIDGMHSSEAVARLLAGDSAAMCSTACSPVVHPDTPNLLWGLPQFLAAEAARGGKGLHALVDVVRLRDELAALPGNVGAAAAEKLHAARDRAADAAAAVRANVAAMRDSVVAGTAGAPDAARAALERAQAVVSDLSRLQEHWARLEVTAMLKTLPAWPILVFLLSATCCLAFSATFHLFHCVDPFWFDFLAKLDYAGIGVLIAGSSVPPLYYGFFCESTLRWTYLGLMFAACVFCVAILFVDRFKSPEYRTFRMLVFVGTGLSGAVPIGHLMVHKGLFSDEIKEIIGDLILMGALYIGGAVLYAARVPERFLPGAFDFVLSSHNIFHLFVVLAALVHYFTVVRHYKFRAANMECAA